MRTRFLCLALAVAACSGTDSIALSDYAKKEIAAFCANQVTCQQMPDTATCEASFELNSTGYMTLVAAANAKLVKYDGAEAASCVNEFASQSCAYTGFQPNKNDPCNKVFTGTVATGGACFVSQECAGVGAVCNPTSASCNPSTTCCPGTCAPAPAKMGVGGACQGSSDCNDGLYCSDKTQQCTAIATASGAACEALDGCANPMLCNENCSTSTGTCYTPAARNATCDTTQVLPCADERDYCDNTTKKCTQVVALGATCDSAGTGNGATCVAYASCTNGSCVENPKAGATCDAMNGPSCLGSLSCTTSTCQLAPAGMACQ